MIALWADNLAGPRRLPLARNADSWAEHHITPDISSFLYVAENPRRLFLFSCEAKWPTIKLLEASRVSGRKSPEARRQAYDIFEDAGPQMLHQAEVIFNLHPELSSATIVAVVCGWWGEFIFSRDRTRTPHGPPKTTRPTKWDFKRALRKKQPFPRWILNADEQIDPLFLALVQEQVARRFMSVAHPAHMLITRMQQVQPSSFCRYDAAPWYDECRLLHPCTLCLGVSVVLMILPAQRPHSQSHPTRTRATSDRALPSERIGVRARRHMTPNEVRGGI
jgi:hypothetical protein